MLALLVLALWGAAPADDVPVAVLRQPVARGERIEAGDLAIENRPVATARGALSIEEAAGMEATRNLNVGSVIRRTDITKPQVVRRGEPVTARIISGPLVITASGRALGGGAPGDPVRVIINATSRTLDGVVESAGTVRITNP